MLYQVDCLSMQKVRLPAFVTMTTASEVERELRAKAGDFELKPNDTAKSDVRKKFSLIFRKNAADTSSSEMKYFCACNGYHRVYMYMSAYGGSFRTKNLIDHMRH